MLKNKLKESGQWELLGHFKNYFSAEIALKAIGFISIPVMTRILSPEDYGILNLFTSYLGIFTVLFTLNVYVAVGRYFYENAADFKFFFGTTILLLFITISLSSLLILFFSDEITELLELPEGLVYYFIPLVVFAVIMSMFVQIYQPLKKSKTISKINIANAAMIFVMSVLFIINLNSDKYLGAIYSYLVVGSFSSIYLLYKLKNYLSLNLNRKAVKYILSYSIPLIPYALSSIILAQFDRIMINGYEGSESVGLYSFAYNVGMLLAVFHSALNSAWIPYYYQYMGEKKYIQHDKDIGFILQLIVLAAVFLSFFGKEIGLILSAESFHSSLDIVPVIVLSYFFFSIYYVYSRNFEYFKKTVISSVVVLVCGIINILLNMYAFPIYGYKSAAITTLISYMLMALLAWTISKFYLKVHSTPLRVIVTNTYLIIPSIAAFYFIQYLKISFFNEVLVKIFLFVILSFLIYRKIRSMSSPIIGTI